MGEVEIPVVEKHHIWFAITSIIVALVVKLFLFKEMKPQDMVSIYYFGYLFFLFMILKPLIFLIYAILFKLVSRQINRSKRPLGIGDINLVASTIITTLVIDDLTNLTTAFIIIIPAIIVIFFLSYFINHKIVKYPG